MSKDSIALASAFRTQATIFRMSAEVLHKDFQANGEALPKNLRAIPFYFLLTHSAELLLKCALMKRGVDIVALKKPGLRHNLSALLDELKKFDCEISLNTQDLLTKLGNQHKEHLLRYAKPGQSRLVFATFTPSPSAIFEALDELLMVTKLKP